MLLIRLKKRMIPAEVLTSKPEAFEHRVVFSTRWGNSWQFWFEEEEEGLFMLEEDWYEFVNDNLLAPDHKLLLEHEDTIFFQVQIFDKNDKEIIDVPVEAEPEPEPEPVRPTPQTSHYVPVTPFASSSAVANGGSNGRATTGSGQVVNPKRYLRNPENAYFVKTITKKNDVLYVKKSAIPEFGLVFGPPNSPINYILPEGTNVPSTVRFYTKNGPCFGGWSRLCQDRKTKIGDNVVCELERTNGVVTGVRLHFINE